MIKTICILFVFLLSACSINQTRRPISQSQVLLSGGRYNEQSWDDDLSFSRFSWYHDATLTHEVLIAPLSKESKFSFWLGESSEYLTKCIHFKVALVYADLNTAKGVAHIVSEIEKSGYKRVSLLDFSHQLKAHQNYLDWKLGQHKIMGFCQEDVKAEPIKVTIPGFMTRAL
ncbi:MAG: hypothetical protein HON90_00755 [Halobacteriovoraceae bacterium]|jgi:hypothetical protein|nr:hypothetical protein [Halobacteriovoraceae bacterium]